MTLTLHQLNLLNVLTFEQCYLHNECAMQMQTEDVNFMFLCPVQHAWTCKRAEFPAYVWHCCSILIASQQLLNKTFNAMPLQRTSSPAHCTIIGNGICVITVLSHIYDECSLYIWTTQAHVLYSDNAT